MGCDSRPNHQYYCATMVTEAYYDTDTLWFLIKESINIQVIKLIQMPSEPSLSSHHIFHVVTIILAHWISQAYFVKVHAPTVFAVVW